ncbi:MAG: DUF4238 domain-containing protein [Nitrospinae bacterium]|nr:DUF4238 domain-containing protein [Nitrospinota bacterium]MBL7021009.1 DUF4238 domain-containing protein [Nitrospinaceae bacterium]
MPLDHYVSQVYLRNFYSSKLGEKLFGIRKRDLHQFPCGSEDVCRIQNGSTNEYLLHDRAIEEFLYGIEPKYNTAIDKLRRGEVDAECIYVISGFIAYVQSCSPAGMRIHSAMPKNAVENTAKMLDAKGEMPPAPAALGGKNITELLETGVIKVEVDPKYPQSIGIGNIMDSVSAFGNFYWEILLNKYSDSPFFTSDFPVTIENTNLSRGLNRVVPLAPDLALRIVPNIYYDKEAAKQNFSQHRFIIKKLSRKQVRTINKLIVQCAEKSVFYSGDQDWVQKFVSKFCRYRIEPLVEEIQVHNATYSIFNQKISEIAG